MDRKKPLIVIKLGGGLIAPKTFPEETADIEVIRKIAKDIKELIETNNSVLLVNGSGNYGHSWAKKYETQKGFGREDKDKKWGAARTQYSASLINKIVVGELLTAGIAASSISPHDIWRVDGKKLKNLAIVRQVLNAGIVPVLYGDVIWDVQKGCQIYSGETLIYKIVADLNSHDVKVERIIQLSIEKGVWDENKNIIPEINLRNWNDYKKAITGSFGVDVTGGMLHKVETSLKIANKFGVNTYISNNLKNTADGTMVSGMD